jgi:hypothetical protein
MNDELRSNFPAVRLIVFLARSNREHYTMTEHNMGCLYIVMQYGSYHGLLYKISEHSRHHEY